MSLVINARGAFAQSLALTLGVTLIQLRPNSAVQNWTLSCTSSDHPVGWASVERKSLRWVTVIGFCLPSHVDRFVDRRAR